MTGLNASCRTCGDSGASRRLSVRAFERICFPRFCRRQPGLWAGRRDLRTPFLRGPSRDERPINADFSMGSRHFLHSNNFSFFPCGNREVDASAECSLTIVFCTKIDLHAFRPENDARNPRMYRGSLVGAKSRACFRRADGKERKWLSRRKACTPSTSAI